MRRFRLCLLLATVLAALAAGNAAAQAAAAGAEQELRPLIQEMLDAIAPGHADVWRRLLHERMIHVDESGTVRTRQALLKEFEPLPPGLIGRIAIDTFKVETHGDVAIVAYEVQEHLDYHGQILRSRFRINDTWQKGAQGWQLLGEQVSAVLKDPPSVKLSQKALCDYNGTYTLTKEIVATIRCSPDGLTAERSGRPSTRYLAEVADVFFVEGQPRTRRIFVRDAQGKVVAFVDRREGEDVRWQKTP